MSDNTDLLIYLHQQSEAVFLTAQPIPRMRRAFIGASRRLIEGVKRVQHISILDWLKASLCKDLAKIMEAALLAEISR
ncbi:hypothetical protein NIES593_12740 [Hydrococcus rivularis NIES-593]|uniref:Uncharacterized protein n=1 Tax=Hydrococcus rivularis NIES-593 TaxID=1921803 RepID=A0A1U7HFH6_9CYAN|nr:hypothetical protein NIES593_12740 [Hydrococcus rivularis NIES-593]